MPRSHSGNSKRRFDRVWAKDSSPTSAPMSLHGRVLVATNGRFVEANGEIAGQSVGQVWSKPTGSFGSIAGTYE